MLVHFIQGKVVPLVSFHGEIFLLGLTFVILDQNVALTATAVGFEFFGKHVFLMFLQLLNERADGLIGHLNGLERVLDVHEIVSAD